MDTVPPGGTSSEGVAPPRGLPSELGRALVVARLRRGFSCQDVAQMAGVDRTHIWRLEHGLRTPSRPLVKALAEVLGLDPTTEALLAALAKPEVD